MEPKKFINDENVSFTKDVKGVSLPKTYVSLEYLFIRNDQLLDQNLKEVSSLI